MKVAKEAITAHNAAAPGLYAAMRSNLELFAKEENRVLAEYAAVAAKGSYAYDNISLAKNDLDQMLGTNGKSGSLKQFLDETIPTKLEEMKGLGADATSQMKSANKAIADLNTLIQKKKDQINTFNGSIALLRQAFIDAPDLLGTGSSAASTGVNGLFEHFSALVDKEVSYVDADGQNKKAKVLDVAADSYQWMKGDGKQVLAMRIPNAPGIDLVLLNLSLEMQQLDRDQAKADLNYLKETKRVLEDAYTRTHVARLLLEEARPKMAAHNDVVELSSFVEGNARQMRDNLTKKQVIVNSHRDTRELFAAIRKVVVAKNNFFRAKALMDVSLGRLDHDRSVVQSSFNDSRHRALITKAVEGLQIYHAGGFTPEHAATILRIAQVVALGSIAEKL